MKKFRSVLCILLAVSVLLSFSGCSFRFSSFDDLLKPPKLSGKYQGLQDSFEKLVDKDYNLCTPENGSYRSAFIVNDFDHDNDEEAIVFYTVKKEPDLVKMYYFEFKDNDWEAVNSYDGLGSSVDQVMLADVNRNGALEIIIGWNLFSSKTNKVFSVYDITGGKLKTISSFSYSTISVFDVNGDGIDDIFTINIDSSVPDKFTAEASVYSYDVKTASMTVLGSTKTDGNVSSYVDIVTEKVDDVKLIYVDAYKGDNDMITEIIYWDEETNKLVAPLFDVSTQSTVQTLRHSRLRCMDVDQDGYLEIPSSVDMPGSSVYTENSVAVTSSNSSSNNAESLYYTKWSKFRDGRIKATNYSVIDEISGYILFVPSSWVGRITVLGNEGQWDYYHWDSYEEKIGKLLFSIYYYDKNDQKASNNLKSTKLLSSYSSTVYVYKITADGVDFGVEDEILKNNFNTTVLGGKK